jgi:ATP-binding cassette subfamily B protein
VFLKDINFTFNKGDFIALEGDSGAGKTTILRLLLALIEPSKGSISLQFNNGKSMEVGRGTRPLFAYVPQGNIIFSGTIGDNIAFAS